ncbi:MAG TPA: DUF1501 domain-containing protein [Fimbriimonadaceae bacterium]|nr:DUF1501 domain-containing protein [Fimbriimonadaceae bacterium]
MREAPGALPLDAERPGLRPTRRNFLVGLGLGSLAWAMPRTALSQIAVDPKSAKAGRSIVVSLFLRGGADGLNVVVPYADDAYHRNRPTLRLLRPGEGDKKSQVLDLDGFFGFNPALASLLPIYRDGRLAVLHAAGSGDQTRSHFEAMNTMERGLAAGSAGPASGWLARHLATSEPAKTSPMRAVAFGGTMPDSLRGATDAIAINGLDDYRLAAEDEREMRAALQDLYGTGRDAMSLAGCETLQVLETLNRLDPKSYRPSNGAKYPKSDLGQALEQVALLIRADVGLEVAVLDKGGWDTHVAQGVATGLLSANLQDLGDSLAAFAQDLGAEMSRITLVAQTEFGRRLHENSGLGTDHGRASFMLVLGGGVKGGKVYAKWPGLEDSQLEPPGDLRVTTDYRQVLADVLNHSFGSRPQDVFEGPVTPTKLFD